MYGSKCKLLKYIFLIHVSGINIVKVDVLRWFHTGIVQPFLQWSHGSKTLLHQMVLIFFLTKKYANCLSYIFLLRQMHLGLKINDKFCQYDHIKGVRHYLLKLFNTKIVSRSETVPDWLLEDIYPSFQATSKILIIK